MNWSNKKKILLAWRNVHSCFSRKEAVLVVFAAWIQQLSCTVSAPVVGCKEKKVNGERRSSAMLLVLARVRVSVTWEVTLHQWQSTDRRKACSLLDAQRLFSIHTASGRQWHKDCPCASTSHSACYIGGKVIMVFRSVEEWWPDMLFYGSQLSLGYWVSLSPVPFAFTCI